MLKLEIEEFALRLWKWGLELSKDGKSLIYPFPHDRGGRTPYLGAVHGLSGILYILMHCIEISDKL